MALVELRGGESAGGSDMNGKREREKASSRGVIPDAFSRCRREGLRARREWVGEMRRCLIV